MAFGGHDIICIGTSATMASEGSSIDQKREVARVAQTLFGAAVDETQVIGETLERATPDLNWSRRDVLKESLRSALASADGIPADYESFRSHPLSSWIETTFGVQTEEGTGRLIRQHPRRLRGPESAATELADFTGSDLELTYDKLRAFLLQGSELRRSESSRFPIFAFRLHQFLTRGDTVWATIEAESVRHLEFSKLVAKPGEPEKTLFPLVFCRQCGTAYYRLSTFTDSQGRGLTPREDRREEGVDSQAAGYLYVSSATPWPTGDGQALLNRLPPFMKEMAADGTERIRSDSRGDLPERLFVDATGRVVPEGKGIDAALIRQNFLFCLEPSCGVVWAR